MALGVLNNLSAIYAENNLNNTSSSLQTVLEQLSSGSRINSGADDAAGLSLVNGLKANSTALVQSATNATEGVGLLQVADGALSQVTSLLDRAITLATEASNGTLNSSQDSAANQEYQSIMAEINNIGSTTTYNQQTVFGGGTVAIYTGDSSTTGSSVDQLNIRALSSASVGGTNGAMSYSNGSNNVFIDLSNAGKLATTNDALVNAATTVVVTYLSAGPNGTVTQQSVNVPVGAGSGRPDTAQGLIDAINNAGLGLTASFTTAAQAGTQAVSAGNAADTGILISGPGAGVGNGTAPGAVGTLSIAGAGTGAGDMLSGSLTVKDSSGVSHIISLAGTTLAGLAATITAGNYGITVTGSGTTTLTFTSASSQAGITGSALADTTIPAGSLTYAAGTYYTTGVSNSVLASDVADIATGQTGAAPAAFSGDTNGTGGIATMSYTDSAGQSLASTDLTTAAHAQTALNYLNLAISDVAAQDGYIGAQINTLNSISQVMSTQQENVVSAQNAIQATDYASATSNMSKYEILSQTGIAALAQANQVEQEVTKLLQ
jgi:flagellin